MPKKHLERFKNKRKSKMEQMEKRGMLRNQIGRKFGMSRANVSLILGKRKVKHVFCLWCGEAFQTRSVSRVGCTRRCDYMWKTHKMPREAFSSMQLRRYIIRFSQRIAPPTPDGCWEWQGFCNPITGYGAVSWKGNRCSTHRVMWALVYGDIQENLHVLHTCDNRKCVNPLHLFLGTQQDNMKDRDAKSRHHSGPRLSVAAVRAIRKSYRNTKDLPVLVARYGVGADVIWNAAHFKTYKHIDSA